MAQQHDLFDDIIDISKGLGALKNPLGGISDSLMGIESEENHWNPADYKEKPRGNSNRCLACIHEGSSCNACKVACPVNAVDIDDGGIDILDICRKCGLCAAACPTEAMNSPKIKPKQLYDKIAGAAASHTTAYVTCTRALRRRPRENEIVLACIGDVTPEVWFAVLADYSNVSAYLPLGICDHCKTTTGEEMLGDAIATAEEWAGTGLGLEVEAQDLKCVKRREYERKEFMDNMMRTTGLTVSKLNPAAAAVASVTQKLKAHSDRITQLERTLNNACGSTDFKRRRVLTQNRQLLLSALQDHPELADNIEASIPQCDFDKCTMCGACVDLCPTNATDLVGSGKFTIEPEYCVGCGLCVEACENHALKMVTCPGSELVVPDSEAEEKAVKAAKAREEAAKMKADAKKKLTKVLAQVEKLAD